MLEVKRKPRHPGELIQRQYFEPLGMTIAELAAILLVSLFIRAPILCFLKPLHSKTRFL